MKYLADRPGIEPGSFSVNSGTPTPCSLAVSEVLLEFGAVDGDRTRLNLIDSQVFSPENYHGMFGGLDGIRTRATSVTAKGANHYTTSPIGIWQGTRESNPVHLRSERSASPIRLSPIDFGPTSRNRT